MKTVTIVDTSICTDNLGDEIIMDAVNKVVWELFPSAYIYRVPSHEPLSDRTREFVRQSDFCFVGGTNLLSSYMDRDDALWKIGSKDSKYFAVARTVCLGTGWGDYMPSPSAASQRLLHSVLSRELMHAARDSYTRDYLIKIGLDAVCTSCPTMWTLTPDHCSKIPTGRANSAVFTLSAWRRDPEADRAFVEVLRRQYRHLYFFSQMHKDLSYLDSFGLSDVKHIQPTVEAYTHFLESEDVDFVGTRLHGGIRALQKGRRALILSIDNRAAEISKDTGLPVLARNDLAGIERWIEDGAPTRIALPQSAIDEWKEQFSAERVSLLTPISESARRELKNRSLASKSVGSAKRVIKSVLQVN
ncbi:polysaccharide pyruvyl transferase family protein [Rhodoligotrophos ferricapiens]|uniref:polysaccharide pyruvyl transferase family protein n=1 Tax=Rhodoligotrophos ferricapiens TaxID=3069264 RepID=UPI00315D9C8B